MVSFRSRIFFQVLSAPSKPQPGAYGSDHRTGFNDGLLVITYISYFIRSSDLGRLPSTSFAQPLTSMQIPEGPASVIACSSTPTVGISSATVTSEAVSTNSAPTSFSQISGMPVASTHMFLLTAITW